MFPTPGQPQSLKCDRCGAYLSMPADPNVLQMECPYCKYTQLLPDVAQRRAAMQSAQLMQHGMNLASQAANTSRRIGAVVGIVAAVVPLVIIAIVFSTLYSSGVFGNARTASWNGTGPLICSGNDHVEVTGVVANQPGAQVVIASGNCHLELHNVSITAMTPIVASGNAQVTVTGGALIGYGASVMASGNANVIVSGAAVTGVAYRRGNATVMGVPGGM
jgi:hypothetical protein